jgi:hypothetical protein
MLVFKELNISSFLGAEERNFPHCQLICMLKEDSRTYIEGEATAAKGCNKRSKVKQRATWGVLCGHYSAARCYFTISTAVCIKLVFILCINETQALRIF